MIVTQLKRLAKGSFIYGIGNALSRFLSFLLVPVFTRYLQPEDYGVMAMLAILNVVLTGVFSLGTANSMGVCYFEAKNKTGRRDIVWTTVGLLLVNCLLFLAIGAWVAPQISTLLLQSSDYAYLVTLSLAGLAVNTITTPFHSYLRMEERAKTFIIITTISTLLVLGLNVYAVVYLGRGVKGILEANFIARVVALVATIIILWPALKFGLNLRWIQPLIKIGYPSIFGLGAFFVIDWADRAMIQRMVGVEELGIYSLGYTFGLAMAVVAEGAFGSAWPPFFISFINKKNEAVILFGYIFKYCLFAYGTLALVFFLVAQPLVTLMTTEPFYGAYTVVGLIAFSYVLKVCYLIMLPGFYFEKKLHLQTGIEWVAAIINVGTNFLLIPLLYKEGAAVATLLSYLSLTLLAYFIGQKLLTVEYDWKNIGKYMVAFSVVAIFSYFQIMEAGWFNMMFKGMLFVAFCVSVYFLILTSRERKIVLGFVTQIYPKFLYAKV